MGTSLLNQWFSHGEIKAICWTLIHSLWVGMIIALLAALVIVFTRKSGANLRYRLLCGILVLFVVSVSVVFCFELRSRASVQSNPNNIKFLISPANVIVANNGPVTQQTSAVNVVVNFLDSYINVIFVTWLLFFMLKSLKMVSGLLYIKRIRTYRIHEVTEDLKHKLLLFSRQIGIRRTVCLVQSELVKVPVAVGWLKPMILLPIGVIFQLSPEQLDSILWHELAHIYRRDYLINILQGLVEVVFFFNPGLLWLSALIRAEREACCDDMVLSRMNRKANYLEALLSFGFDGHKQASLAMGIGSGNQLRDRLKRMVSQENKRLSMAEKAVLAVGLVLLTAFTTISKDNPLIKHISVKFASKSGKVINKNDTVALLVFPNGQEANDSKPNGGQKHSIIFTDTTIRFTSVLFKNTDADLANRDISAKDDKGNVYHFVITDNKLIAMELNGEKIADDKLAGFEYMIRYIDRQIAEKRRVRIEDIAAYKANSPGVKYKGEDSIWYHKGDGRSADVIKAKIDQVQQRRDGQSADKVRAKIDGIQYRNNRQSADAMDRKTEVMLKRRSSDSTSYAGQVQRAHNVIADLVKEKVVPNAAAVKWFGLSDTELIVNGEKQPAELQQRLKAKYGVYENNGLYYGPVQMTGTGVFIDNDEQLGARHDFEQLNLKEQQLIQQQQLFAADENKKRDQLINEQQQLVKQQERFTADENEKREQIMKEQQQLVKQQGRFVADENKKRQQIIKQQQLLLTDQARGPKLGANLQPAIAGVIGDLVSADVINDKSGLIKFNLTNSALMVNDKKQSEELHEKLKAKYLRPMEQVKSAFFADPNFGLHFNAQNGNSGMGITADQNGP